MKFLTSLNRKKILPFAWAFPLSKTLGRFSSGTSKSCNIQFYGAEMTLLPLINEFMACPSLSPAISDQVYDSFPGFKQRDATK